jgi:enterochelin esterase-like enzyme
MLRVRTHAALIADDLIRHKELAPFIIVFVDPIDRMAEYWANGRFAGFIAIELVPFINAKYRTRARRAERALMGASLGGIISRVDGSQASPKRSRALPDSQLLFKLMMSVLWPRS